MRYAGIIAQLSEKLGTYRDGTTGQEYLFWCPYPLCKGKSSKPHLSINPGKQTKYGKGAFKCWKCGEHGSLERLCRELGIEYEAVSIGDLGEFDQVVNGLIIDVPKSSNGRVDYSLVPSEEYYPYVPEYTQAYRYLTAERGFTRDEITKYRMGLGIKRLRDRIVLPEFEGENMIFWQARSYSEREPKYMSPSGNKDGHVWNLDRTSLLHEHVRIAEGIFSGIRCGDNGVAIYSYNFMPGQVSVLLRAQFKTYTIVFDGEMDAYKKAHELGTILVGYGVDHKDVFISFVPLGHDPDDIGMQGMEHIFQQKTFPWSPDLLLDVYGGIL